MRTWTVAGYSIRWVHTQDLDWDEYMMQLKTCARRWGMNRMKPPVSWIAPFPQEMFLQAKFSLYAVCNQERS